MGAIRGTTPDYILTLDGYNLTGRKVFVTIAQGLRNITLTGERLTVVADESGSTIAFSLTQAETLMFTTGNADIQVKCIDSAGNVDGSGIGVLTIDRALLDKEISYADDTD